jgi:hypothetical protein
MTLTLMDFMDNSKRKMNEYSKNQIHAQSKEYFGDNFNNHIKPI